jgi:tRNA pseudouridine38-40 synthase|tara:strand:- start:2333 stop:3133 length:801 start_codon:yes stop_codon:yes gene_type:complete
MSQSHATPVDPRKSSAPLPDGVTRFRLVIEYDGGPFQGWQRQKDHPSVQQFLEEAAGKLSDGPVLVQGAGRTDSGVHATGQVAHLDLARQISCDKLRDALNFHLKPNPISILLVERANADFHARFSARGRSYLYRIATRRAPLALDRGRAWSVPRKLDIAAMQAGADRLIGHHDFTSFRATHCQARTPMKTLDVMKLEQQGSEIHVIASSRSFLHHQVRNMVGTLKLVGEGKWTPDDVSAALRARDRSAGGPTAPAHGLYLTAVAY